MSRAVRLASGTSVQVDDGESILDAAERAGRTLEYSCRTGRCSTCKALVSEGTTTARAAETGLESGEGEAGWILTCVRTPESDVVLAVDSELDVALPPVRTVPCRVNSIRPLSDDVVEVVLRYPSKSGWSFLPGQHVEVQGPGGVRRSYSIADAGAQSGVLSLHIRKVEQGQFSAYWFGEAKQEDLLRFRGPLGTFFLRAEDQRPLVFLATGTGIAPVKAALEHLAANQPSREVHVYFGGRRLQDLYWTPPADWPVDWRFTSVLSRPEAGWAGRLGYVQDALLADGVDLTEAEVYACGSDAMVHSAREATADRGRSPERFYADAFVSSAPMLEKVG